MPLCLDGAYLSQAKADYETMTILRESPSPDCHWLHMLQMTLEKLGKAFRAAAGEQFERLRGSHVTARTFLNMLARAPLAPTVFRMTAEQLRHHTRALAGIAVSIEQLAPAVGTERNVEYPWLFQLDQYYVPCGYQFEEAGQIASSAHGRKLLKLIEIVIERWDELV